MPRVKPNTKNLEKLKKIIAPYGAPVWDLEQIGLPLTHFKDPNHLNQRGAKESTKKIDIFIEDYLKMKN